MARTMHGLSPVQDRPLTGGKMSTKQRDMSSLRTPPAARRAVRRAASAASCGPRLRCCLSRRFEEMASHTCGQTRGDSE